MIIKKIQLRRKVAFITGDAQGIGKGFAGALREFGTKIIIGDLNIKLAQKTSSEIKKRYSVDSMAIELDVRSSDSIKYTVNNTINSFGKIDIAINNAGIAANENAENISDIGWRNLLDVNLSGVFFYCREEAKSMIKNGGGIIANIASMSSIVVNHLKKQSYYNALKAGVVLRILKESYNVS